MVYGLCRAPTATRGTGSRRTSSSSTASATTTSASPAARTVASGCTSPGARWRSPCEEWLYVIPDFELAIDEQLMERGGGAMMALCTLPLRWEVKS